MSQNCHKILFLIAGHRINTVFLKNTCQKFFLYKLMFVLFRLCLSAVKSKNFYFSCFRLTLSYFFLNF
uniref:Uncharacterized protein n=1 Tax=Siphoviridae sp. ctDiR9 TaxID=2825388 RepID=A0A8S5PRR1_9CAUD|nr:MAG TPA: hypothetical protein [Siphoviridae sp. ctDiR9]